MTQPNVQSMRMQVSVNLQKYLILVWLSFCKHCLCFILFPCPACSGYFICMVLFTTRKIVKTYGVNHMELIRCTHPFCFLLPTFNCHSFYLPREFFETRKIFFVVQIPCMYVEYYIHQKNVHMRKDK